MPALVSGSYRSLDAGHDDIFAFMRETGTHRVCVILNFSGVPQSTKLGEIGECIAGTIQVDGDGSRHSGGFLELAGHEGRVYEMRRGQV